MGQPQGHSSRPPSVSIPRPGETANPTWEARETLSLGNTSGFLPHRVMTIQGHIRKRPCEARGRTGWNRIRLDPNTLANLNPAILSDCSLSQNSMLIQPTFPLPSATRSVRTDLFYGYRVGFLKPIEHLILDDSISEVMVNGATVLHPEESWLSQHPRQSSSKTERIF